MLLLLLLAGDDDDDDDGNGDGDESVSKPEKSFNRLEKQGISVSNILVLDFSLLFVPSHTCSVIVTFRSVA